MNTSNGRAESREQLKPAGIVVGCAGCVIITASSVYTALKMGALPWPTIFTSITALVVLRALGRKSLNEANITQVIMSAGSMVAGGLAFTIPGIWMLGLDEQVGLPQLLAVALAGTLLGLVCTALIRRRFVEESDLEYPIGTAAAQTLLASSAGGATGKKLFGSMALAGIWCALRDVAGAVPAMIAALPIPGVNFALYNSPMLCSVGFLVGGAAVAFWFAGALIGNFGIVVGGSAARLWDVAAAQGIVSSLGMGLMMGSGLGVVIKDILPKAADYLKRGRAAGTGTAQDADDKPGLLGNLSRMDAGALGLLTAAAACLACLVLGLSPIAAVVVVALAFVTTIMSAQSVGQTGIDPMEIFGLIVLLAIAAMGEHNQVKLFFVAAIIAIACGLAGDVMSDFKTGAIIGTNPRDLWRGQAIGSLLGCIVSVAVMAALLGAYGADAFGPGKLFLSAHARVVATMVSGIPSIATFGIGIIAGIALYCLGIPSMMLGLGIYLPFYMSLTAAVGALIKAVYDRIGARRATAADAETTHEESGIIVASGILGGESIVGVIIALVSVASGMLG